MFYAEKMGKEVSFGNKHRSNSVPKGHHNCQLFIVNCQSGMPAGPALRAAPRSSGKLPRISLSFLYHFYILYIRQNPQPVSRGFCNKKEERKMKKIKIKFDLSLVYPEDVKKERE